MSDFQDAYQAGAAQTRATLPNTLVTPLTVLVDGEGAERIVSVERHAVAPSDKRGIVKVYDEASFCAYVTAHKRPGTQVFADIARTQIIAVLDHHAPDVPGPPPAETEEPLQGLPGWGRHRCELVTRLTPEWVAWTGRHGKKTNQVEFAEFIENHIAEIAEPTGSTLLEMVRTLEVKRDAEFRSAINLTTGETQLLYEESVDGTAQKGMTKIPKEFILGLAPFETDVARELYRLVARLRYRMDGGKLTIWIDLLNPEKVLEAAFRERLATVQAGLHLTPLMGEAPAETQPLSV